MNKPQLVKLNLRELGIQNVASEPLGCVTRRALALRALDVGDVTAANIGHGHGLGRAAMPQVLEPFPGCFHSRVVALVVGQLCEAAEGALKPLAGVRVAPARVSDTAGG